MWPARTSGVRLRLLCSLSSACCRTPWTPPAQYLFCLQNRRPCGAGVRSEDAAVEKLLQRLSDGILPDDRREALAQLRDLLSGNPQVRSWASLCSRNERGPWWVNLQPVPAGAGCAWQRRAARAVHGAAE